MDRADEVAARPTKVRQAASFVRSAGAALAAALLCTAALAAGEVLIYRCTDVHGHDTYQDSRCPINSFEHVIRMQRPIEPPEPPKPPQPPAPPPAPVAPPSEVVEDVAPEAEAPPPVTFSLPPWETAEPTEHAPPPPRGFSLPPWETGLAEDSETVPSSATDLAEQARLRGFSLPPWETGAGENSEPASSSSSDLAEQAKLQGFSLPPWETGAEPGTAEGELAVVKLRPAPRPAPPPLWRCRGLDRKAYISDTATPPPKCIPLSELGIDVSALPKLEREGCRDVHDACDRLDDAATCEHYAELRTRAAVAAGDNELTAVPELRAEFLRLDGIWRQSCSVNPMP